MKKVFILSLLVVFSLAVFAAAPFHIGIVTGTVSQSEDDLRGAEQLIKEYGDANDGGYIVHVTYPDNFMQEVDTTIAQIAGLADDPMMKAIVVNQAVPGTVAAFRRIRETRPDILLLGTPHEDPTMAMDTFDLAINPDNVARGYLIIAAAKKLGAEKFMHISFPRHMGYELLSRRRDIMREACEDLGLEFIDMGSPDPTSDIGIAGAQQFILEKVPAWLEQYGDKTAFFCTNDAHTEPLLKRIAELGGFFIEADLPSPTMGYPGALGVTFTEDEKGNWPAILAKVQEAVLAKGGANRMGTWAFSFGFTATAGLGEHAKRCVEGVSDITDADDVMASFMKYTPGAGWNGTLYVDADGVEAENYMLIYQDTYVFNPYTTGGFLGMTEIEVPAKYFDID